MRRPRFPVAVALLAVCSFIGALPAAATITIKDRTLTQPLVLDQNEDYYLSRVYVSGITDLAALTLTGKIGSVTLSNCVFSNIWAGTNGKAVAAEAQGAIVNSFVATDTAFEDAQHQLVCLREGAFGTVTFQRCKFRTSDSFLKRIYSEDPWRTSPPTTEFANIDRLELIDNEYSNTILIVHPSVKMVIFRGDISNLRLQSPGTHVIRLEKGQDPATIAYGTALAMAPPPLPPQNVEAQDEPANTHLTAASPARDQSGPPTQTAATGAAAPEDPAEAADPSSAEPEVGDAISFVPIWPGVGAPQGRTVTMVRP
jgi:hypothetical protein